MTEIKKSKSHQNLISTAKTLFMKYGIKRITVEEICKDAGVSKMTFYRLFNNKEEIAEKIFIEIADRNMLNYQNIMNQDISYPEKVRQTVLLKQTSMSHFGEEFIKDIFQNENVQLMQLIENYRKKGNDLYIADFKKAQKKGEIRQDIKPEFILYILDILYEKLKDDRLISMYKNTQEATMELTKFFFYGILPNKD